ncbi:MAG: NADH-quinone oxidoreductase subunit NuoE family protein [bacterium]
MTCADTSKANALPESVTKEIDHWLGKYPKERSQSALLAALRAVQHHDHHVSVEKMDGIAAYLGLPPIAVYEVASFYSMYNLEPAGRHELAVCNNISCMLRGGDEIIEHIEKKLNIKWGESTPDGKFYLKKEEECLAACCGAPMMQVNHVYYENLTPEKVDEILDGLD